MYFVFRSRNSTTHVYTARTFLAAKEWAQANLPSWCIRGTTETYKLPIAKES